MGGEWQVVDPKERARLLTLARANTTSFGGKVSASIAAGIEWATGEIGVMLSKILLATTKSQLELMEKEYAPLLKDMAKMAINTGKLPDSIKPLLDEVINPKHQIGSLVMSSLGGAAMGGIASSILDPILLPLAYGLNYITRFKIVPLESGILMNQMGLITDEGIQRIAANYGFDRSSITLMQQASQVKLGFADVAELLRRREISAENAEVMLKLLGLIDTNIELLLKLVETQPSAGDYIEAFRRSEVSKDDISLVLSKLGYSDKTIAVMLGISRTLLAPNDIRSLLYHSQITPAEATKNLKALGYADTDVPHILSTFATAPDYTMVREASLRGFIDDTEVDSILKRNGFNGRDSAFIKKMFWIIPSAGDMIRFAVREVFTPETAEEYGLFEDIPSEYVEQAKLTGLDEGWARAYWGAHWELPSPLQGFEMLHRGVITSEDMETLLKSLDVMPFWREKLMAISYNVFTRVDVRRMFQTGVLDREKVKKAYLDMGYDEERAELLTEFTVMGASETELDLSKADVISGYGDGLVTLVDATEMLVKLGYDEEEAKYYLAREDYLTEKARRTAITKIIKELYITRRIEKNDVVTRLTGIGLPTLQVDKLLEMWEMEYQAQLTIPSMAELRRYLKRGIITPEDFKTEVAIHGYGGKYAEWVLADATYTAPEKVV